MIPEATANVFVKLFAFGKPVYYMKYANSQSHRSWEAIRNIFIFKRRVSFSEKNHRPYNEIAYTQSLYTHHKIQFIATLISE